MASKSRLGSGGYGIRRKGSFAGKAVDVGVIADAWLSNLDGGTGGIKKPGIPSDTDPWLKTTMEIMMGRRGNAIEVPAKKELTFSATPTKAECEELYNYTNSMRDKLEQLIRRFDS